MLTLSQFKQLKRYKARALQYMHQDESHLLRDYRNDQRAKPEFRHIHYVGFEVCTEDQTFYYHTSILSDCMEAIYDGVTAIRKGLHKRFAPLQKLTLIYLRSYLTADEDQLDSEVQASMRTQTDAFACKKKINQFIAFTMVGNRRVSRLQAEGRDAIEISIRLDTHVQELHKEENRTFLWICAAHPVSVEFSEHFDYAATRLKMMIDESVDWTSCTIH